MLFLSPESPSLSIITSSHQFLPEHQTVLIPKKHKYLLVDTISRLCTFLVDTISRLCTFTENTLNLVYLPENVEYAILDTLNHPRVRSDFDVLRLLVDMLSRLCIFGKHLLI